MKQNTSTAKKARAGQPPHEPDARSRVMVRALVTAGMTQERTAAVIGINKTTLRKHYPEELASGRDEALGHNTISLMEMARKGNAAAAIYLQKCLGGPAWNEKNLTEHDGTVTLKVVYGDRD